MCILREQQSFNHLVESQLLLFFVDTINRTKSIRESAAIYLLQKDHRQSREDLRTTKIVLYVHVNKENCLLQDKSTVKYQRSKSVRGEEVRGRREPGVLLATRRVYVSYCSFGPAGTIDGVATQNTGSPPPI